ncbi:MAG: hypothetical protein VYD17_02460, partial [Pseudomonadota bacterium]|nr:hypothetical protein [Pseudomonadota bacterium]
PPLLANRNDRCLVKKTQPWYSLYYARLRGTEHNQKQAAIFDDVITTGATVEDLRKCHQEQGVAPVDIVSLARASP